MPARAGPPRAVPQHVRKVRHRKEEPALDLEIDRSTLDTRETVRARAISAGMPAGVTLAIHELAASAVCYGGGTGHLRIQVTGGQLICQVTDSGLAASAATDAPPSSPAAGDWPTAVEKP